MRFGICNGKGSELQVLLCVSKETKRENRKNGKNVKKNKKDVDKLIVFIYNMICVAEVSKIKYNRGVAQLG